MHDWLQGYWYSRFLFERALAVVYLIGFPCALNQFIPLLGEHGLEPAPRFMQLVPFRATTSLFYLFPTDRLVSPAQMMNFSFNPLHLVNTYGAFGSITKERYEIVVEGTSESEVTSDTKWSDYGFKGKPGDPSRLPPQIAPYHLRLDWLMWFAAMSTPSQHPWFTAFLVRLLQGDRATLGLLQDNPFPDRPPRFVRALYYRYRFTTPEEHTHTGRWWNRDLVGLYFPPIACRRTSDGRNLRNRRSRYTSRLAPTEPSHSSEPMKRSAVLYRNRPRACEER